MAKLASAFASAQTNIEPSDDDRDNAPQAHADISALLGSDDTLKEWGINPILIGSYGRQVSIRRVFDVDMFCRLDDYPNDVSAKDVLDKVHEVLVDAYDDDSVTQYERSVTVLVPDADGLYVDVVPAREAGDFWEIPTKDGGWVETNPIVMTELKEQKNSDYDEMYVPCVKLLRQVRRALLGKSKPGGFTVEMAFFTACEEGLVEKTSSMPEFFASALEGVAEVFGRMAEDDFEIPDPSMDGKVLDFDETADFTKARDKFADAASDARAAVDMDDDETGKAALLLQGILGSNDDHDEVFPMPAGYKPDGTKRASVTETRPGDSRTTGVLPGFG